MYEKRWGGKCMKRGEEENVWRDEEENKNIKRRHLSWDEREIFMIKNARIRCQDWNAGRGEGIKVMNRGRNISITLDEKGYPYINYTNNLYIQCMYSAQCTRHHSIIIIVLQSWTKLKWTIYFYFGHFSLNLFPSISRYYRFSISSLGCYRV